MDVLSGTHTVFGEMCNNELDQRHLYDFVTTAGQSKELLFILPVDQHNNRAFIFHSQKMISDLNGGKGKLKIIQQIELLASKEEEYDNLTTSQPPHQDLPWLLQSEH